MTVTALDPKTALIVIDLQKGIVGLPTVHPIAGVLASATALTAAFRRCGLPVVLANATGVAPGRAEQSHSLEGMPTDWADLVPELNAQPNDLLVTKRTWGAFTNTDLEARLRRLALPSWCSPASPPASAWSRPPAMPMNWGSMSPSVSNLE
jgi:nicotinamidase-related amidase